MVKGLPEKIVYHDELNDEFSTMEINAKKIDGSYKYLRDSFFEKIAGWFLFRVIGKPLAYFYLKKNFKHQLIGKEKLKPYKKEAIFLYGNHTQIIGDALIPAFIIAPRRMNVIVHPNNVSIPHLGKYLPYIGALPLPDDIPASKNFMAALEKRIKQKQPIFIYPEAHLWPYYTGIRNFKDTSFVYPVKNQLAAFSFTNTYHAVKNKNKVKIITYIDGPFYPDEGLSLQEGKKNLRDKIYNAMKERAKSSDRALIEYVKGDD